MELLKRNHIGRTWNIFSNKENLILFDSVTNKAYKIIRPLKEHHRSLVYHIEINEKGYVLKIPLEKNNRWWIRFTTLFRMGEAFKNIKGMLKYNELGLHTTTPIMAAEHRKCGMVTDSWLLYEFLDGEPCFSNRKYYFKVVDTLRLIHKKGYLHGDAQIANFMDYNDKIYIIDSNPKKIKHSGFSQAFEFAYLRRSAPDIEEYFGNLRSLKWYRFALWYDQFDRKLALKRRAIKKFFGLKGNK